MINKKLFTLLEGKSGYIRLNIMFKLAALICSMTIITNIATILSEQIYDELTREGFIRGLIIIISFIVLKEIANRLSGHFSYKTIEGFKGNLRDKLLKKLTNDSYRYDKDLSTSEVIQLSAEGVDQLEIYFSRYMPQLIYSVISAVVLFIFLARYSILISLLLFVMVPLIPISIIAVSKFAKRTLDKYWSSYTGLGEIFLENLNGLTTLKIYKTDEMRQRLMDGQSEDFRRATMKVLSMQLNSITIMDLVAYGGSAAGIIASLYAFRGGVISLRETIIIILIASEFFIPMRLLGSFFHISMNGVTASKKIFKLLEAPLEPEVFGKIENGCDISLRNVGFGYDERPIIKNLTMDIKFGEFVTITGPSGSGKSTIARLISKNIIRQSGEIRIGGKDINEISYDQINRNIAYIGNNDYIFSATVRENLNIGRRKDITDEMMMTALERVNLLDLIRERGGLDFVLDEAGANLSGGQKQRLAIARAFLYNPQVYILDESTSNIDSESEEIIMNFMKSLKGKRTVISISHRIYNSIGSDKIFLIKNGELVEQGDFETLKLEGGLFHSLYSSQRDLESYLEGVV